MTPNYQQIPQELRDLPNWVVWRFEERVNEKTNEVLHTKVPYNARTGGHAKSNKLSTWSTFAEALAALERGGYDGVGVCLTPPYVGADLDGCRSPETGLIEPWAEVIIKELDSYAELSPSETGIRVITKGSLPPKGREFSFPDRPHHGVALYEPGGPRYLTMTGSAINGQGIHERTAELERIHAQYFPPKVIATNGQAQPTSDSPANPSDDELIAEITRSRQGAKFSRLWAGDISMHGNDASRADQALCTILAWWTDNDAIRIDALFRRSALFRQDKWADRQDYRERTITRAIEDTPVPRSRQTALGGSSAAFQKLLNGEPTVPLEEFLQSDHTDAGNEECFVRLHGRDYLYNWTAKQWLHWSGVFWRPDTTGTADRHMLEVAEMRLKAAFSMPDSTDEEKAKKEAIEKASRLLRNVTKRHAALESAQSNRSFARETTDFDTKHDLFCCGNGIIDLRSGKFRSGHRSDLITKNTPVIWDPEARCDRWFEFLEEVFPERPEMWSFLQRAVGYSLTGLTSEEMFFLLWGTGRNGKGTFIGTLSALLGDYAHACEMSSLTAKKDDPVRNDLAAMCGARFVTAQESHERTRLDEALIKTLTGGDKISARFLFQEFFQFTPTWKLWLATNHKPEIRGTDLAIWSRPKLIPFTVSFEGRENRGLKAELLSPKVLSGVLRWAVDGAVEYYRSGLAYPDEVLQATREYKAECDLLGRFLEDRCILLPTAECKARALYQAYQKWTEEIGESGAMTEKSFSLQLQSRGYKNKRRTDCKYWFGVNLTTVSPEVDGN
jgi:putative DNA primase/helicase